MRDQLLVEMVDVFFDDAIKVDRLDPDGKKFDKGMFMEASLLVLCRFSFLSVDHQ